MASIVHSVDIDRGADEVFAYVTEPPRFAEWQAAVVDAHSEGSRPLQKGSRLVMTPRMKCYKSAPSSANLRSVARETAGPDETHAAATSAERKANFSRERKCRLPGRGRHPFRAIGDRQPVIKMNLGTTVLALFGTRDGPARCLRFEPSVKSSKALREANRRFPVQSSLRLALVEPMCRAELLREEAGHRRIIFPPPVLPDPLHGKSAGTRHLVRHLEPWWLETGGNHDSVEQLTYRSRLPVGDHQGSAPKQRSSIKGSDQRVCGVLDVGGVDQRRPRSHDDKPARSGPAHDSRH